MNEPVGLEVLDHRLAGLTRPAGPGPTSGLCRALADRLGVDPLVTRLAAVVLIFAAGLGVALYAWGTALTPRVGGTAPIRRIVPSFGTWGRGTQVTTIVATSLLVPVLATPWQGFPLVAVLLLGFLAWRSVRAGHRPGTPPAPGAPIVTSGPSVSAQSAPTVGEWRMRMAEHARRGTNAPQPLPVVDLYAPAAPPRQVQTPVTWLGALAVAVLGVAAGALPAVLGLQHTLLLSLGAATAAVGAAMIAWALLVRSRRLPGALVVLALLLGVATSVVALGATQDSAVAASPLQSGQVAEYRFFADDGVVDLRDVPLDLAAQVRVQATFSRVVILLPGAPESMTTNTLFSELDPGPAGRPTGKNSRLSLTVNSTASSVTVEYPS